MSSLKALGAVLCLVFALCFAAPNAGAQKSSDLPPAVHGSGTVNVIPLWNSSSTLGNSVLSQSGGNLSTSGNFSATGAGTFGSVSTSGDISLAATSSASVGVINAGGFPFIHNFGTNALNTFIGLGAGNFSMTGTFNTASGGGALQSNTGGGNNTVSGAGVLNRNTDGNNNTAVGTFALQVNTTGSGNTAIGSFAGGTLLIGEITSGRR
jgi:trimeric autotransporter adhesin